MKSLFHAVNAVAELSGPPIQERRFLLEFPARAEAANKPELTSAAFGLIGANHLNADKIKSWIPDWEYAFKLACENTKVDIRISIARINYYEKAINAMLEGAIPLAALWPLFHTWTLAADVLDGDHLKFWETAAGELGLLGAGFAERVNELDHFIDDVEITLDEVARENGVETF
jgi:hypothetical protein